MGSVVENLFGGSDDSAQKAQAAANDRTQEFIEEQAALGRSDALGLFPQAQEQRQLSFQQALNAIGGAAPEQARLYNQGNVNAQQALLGGINPFQQAILGQPVDTSGMQAQSLSADFGFIPNQLAMAQPTEGSPLLDPVGGNADLPIGGSPPSTPGGGRLGPQGPTQGFQGGLLGGLGGWGTPSLQQPQPQGLNPWFGNQDNQLLVQNPFNQYKFGG